VPVPPSQLKSRLPAGRLAHELGAVSVELSRPRKPILPEVFWDSGRGYALRQVIHASRQVRARRRPVGCCTYVWEPLDCRSLLSDGCKLCSLWRSADTSGNTAS